MLQQTIATAFFKDPSLAGVALARRIRDASTVIDGCNAESDDFDLRNVLRDAGVTSPASSVYVNVDEMRKVRLDEIAEDLWSIWRPKADDIEIFDDSLSWILSIDHDGNVLILWSLR